MALGATGVAVCGMVAVAAAGSHPQPGRAGRASAAAGGATPVPERLTTAGDAGAHILSLRPRLAAGQVVARLTLPHLTAPENVVEGLDVNPDEVGHEAGTGYPGEPHSMVLVAGSAVAVPAPGAGDLIRLDTAYGTFRYRVTTTHPTAPGADLGPDAADLRLVSHAGGGLAVTVADLVPGDPDGAAEIAQEVAVTRAERTAEATTGDGAAPAAAAGRLRPPVTGPITQVFGPTDLGLELPFTYDGVYYPHFHTGLDIGVGTGTPVAAAAAGTVVLATTNTGSDGRPVGYGSYVLISHGGGLFTLYAHLSRLEVAAGQRLLGGQVIGLSGSTGNSTGPHLHFEVRRGDTPVDPLPLIEGG
jgi:murein DD-endopeptidase MepM/ murein hydrolase activator NlpD